MPVDIKKRRAELNLTLEQIGNYVGVSKSTVKKWESGNIKNMRRDKIVLLSQILHVSPLDFLDFSKPNAIQSPLCEFGHELPPEAAKKIESAAGTPLSDVSIIYKTDNKYIFCSLSAKQLSALIQLSE